MMCSSPIKLLHNLRSHEAGSPSKRGASLECLLLWRDDALLALAGQKLPMAAACCRRWRFRQIHRGIRSFQSSCHAKVSNQNATIIVQQQVSGLQETSQRLRTKQ